MLKTIFLAGVASLAFTAASAATYDFKAEANKTGQIGEAAFDVFHTSNMGVFAGPNLQITAEKYGNSAFVYFDNGNAGIGVCGIAKANKVNSYNPGSGKNLCNPGSDDGLTTSGETLFFTATDEPMTLQSFFINSNHDRDDIMNTVWNIGGTLYDSNDFVSATGGDVRIDVNYDLEIGETISLFGVEGPNSYVSAITVSPSQVPLPAAGFLLLGALGALTLPRRKS